MALDSVTAEFPPSTWAKSLTTTILSMEGRAANTGHSLRTIHYLDQLPDDETPVFVGRVPFERRFVGRCGERLTSALDELTMIMGQSRWTLQPPQLVPLDRDDRQSAGQ